MTLGAVPEEEAADERQTAASMRVAAFLRQAILDGEFQPGDFIRQEAIARRLGASRVPVREALRILEVEGLTEHHVNKGARVPLMTMHEVDVVYQLRERLEPLVLSESMPGLSPADIAQAEQILHRIEAGTDIDEFMRLDREFHFVTYHACRIEQLSNTVVRLWNSTQYYRRLFMKQTGSTRQWVVNAEHRLLLDAIQGGDSVRAEQMLAAHIRRTRTALAESASARRDIVGAC
jgi:DNA-binding GntR family transcriptional regulator